MIRCGFDVVGPQNLSQLLHFFARQTVDNATFASILPNEFNDLLVNVVGFGPHLIIKVGTVERTAKLLCISYAEAFLDVAAHFVGGCGRECNDRCIAYAVDDGADVAIFRTEIVPPFRNAMGFVYGIKRNLDGLQKRYGLFFGQRLGRYIQQFGATTANIVHHFLHSGLRKRRVETMRQTRFVTQTVHHVDLIFHQSNQRRHHNGGALHQKRRQLVAKALATSCRHEHKGVVAGHQILNNSLLITFKLVETKIVFQLLCKISVRCHRLRLSISSLPLMGAALGCMGTMAATIAPHATVRPLHLIVLNAIYSFAS